MQAWGINFLARDGCLWIQPKPAQLNHCRFGFPLFDIKQDRKAELAAKKAKLEELRKQREQRSTAGQQPSEAPSPSHKPLAASVLTTAVPENSSVADLVSSLLGGLYCLRLFMLLLLDQMSLQLLTTYCTHSPINTQSSIFACFGGPDEHFSYKVCASHPTVCCKF
jgi:hypothetical protein